ncbi:MAG: TadE/TadG family type IV pilus assembly protein [Syntrophomonas sp.]
MLRIKKLLIESDAQGLVELAMVLPILLMLLMGILEFGRIYGSYLVISNLAREGARYGVVGNSDSQIRDVIISQRAYLDESKLIVTITPSDADRSKGSPLEVDVDYSVPLLAPFLGDILPDPFPLSAQCFMRVEN